jgi:hypothetical protein
LSVTEFAAWAMHVLDRRFPMPRQAAWTGDLQHSLSKNGVFIGAQVVDVDRYFMRYAG